MKEDGKFWSITIKDYKLRRLHKSKKFRSLALLNVVLLETCRSFKFILFLRLNSVHLSLGEGLVL